MTLAEQIQQHLLQLPPEKLYLWWARRPLAAARARYFSQRLNNFSTGVCIFVFDKSHFLCYKVSLSPLSLREQGARRLRAASAFLTRKGALAASQFPPILNDANGVF